MDIRAATEDDAAAIVGVHFAAVHGTAASYCPAEVLDRWSKSPDERRYQHTRTAILQGDELFVVAQDASGVVGFGSIS